ncbi:hypothetical protein ACFLTP_05235 [Chloroflexota bacterium]
MKNYTMFSIIFTTIGTLIVIIIAGLKFNMSSQELLYLVLGAIIMGPIIGGLGGWFLKRFVFSQLGYNAYESRPGTDVLVNVGSEIDIEYELNDGDVPSFYLYNYEHSPKMVRIRRLR